MIENEGVLFTTAEVAIALAGFSGIVAAFREREARAWSTTERRILWLLIGDSFLVLFFSLLPFPLDLADWSHDATWGFCNALLGSWFIVADALAIIGERRDVARHEHITVPLVTPFLYATSAVALGYSVVLWLSAFDLLVPRGQAVYVLGLLFLLVFGALEFLFFIGLAARPGRER